MRGRGYRTGSEPRFSEPLIELPDPGESLLSFTNLVEAHVLAAIRRKHGVPMQKVRPALAFLEKQLGFRHPLAHRQLLTDGVSLFVEHLGQLIDLSSSGQVAIRELLVAHLERIEHDAEGLAQRLFPFTRSSIAGTPRVVVLDPRIGFGQPVIAGTSVRTEVIAGRLEAGESVGEIAADFGIDTDKVEEALRYELAAA